VTTTAPAQSILPIVTFNAWIGQDATDDQDPRDLRDNLIRMINDASDALHARIAAACLQEVWDWEGTIPGYEAVRAPRDLFRHAEAKSTQWLILERDDFRPSFRQVPGKGWIWNGNHKAPRVFPRVIQHHDGRNWDLTGVHRTPNGPDIHIPLNQESWRLEHDMLVRWQNEIAERRPNRPRALLGDMNAGAREKPGHPQSIANLADAIGARAAMRHIDGGLVAGAEIKRLQRLDGKYGSDGHHPVAMLLVA
jgi:hypothetical protein